MTKLENSNLKLIEERLSFMENNYDETVRRIRDLELEIHHLNKTIRHLNNTVKEWTACSL